MARQPSSCTASSYADIPEGVKEQDAESYLHDMLTDQLPIAMDWEDRLDGWSWSRAHAWSEFMYTNNDLDAILEAEEEMFESDEEDDVYYDVLSLDGDDDIDYANRVFDTMDENGLTLAEALEWINSEDLFENVILDYDTDNQPILSDDDDEPYFPPRRLFN